MIVNLLTILFTSNCYCGIISIKKSISLLFIKAKKKREMYYVYCILFCTVYCCTCNF